MCKIEPLPVCMYPSELKKTQQRHSVHYNCPCSCVMRCSVAWLAGWHVSGGILGVSTLLLAKEGNGLASLFLIYRIFLLKNVVLLIQLMKSPLIIIDYRYVQIILSNS